VAIKVAILAPPGGQPLLLLLVAIKVAILAPRGGQPLLLVFALAKGATHLLLFFSLAK
jgi:hypothetical protein